MFLWRCLIQSAKKPVAFLLVFALFISQNAGSHSALASAATSSANTRTGVSPDSDGYDNGDNGFGSYGGFGGYGGFGDFGGSGGYTGFDGYDPGDYGDFGWSGGFDSNGFDSNGFDSNVFNSGGTGQTVGTSVRPVAVTISNALGALPQHSISQADIIYETLVEGGITRMLGIFRDISRVGDIGSVRSARPYFVEIVQSHDAIFAHGGGSPAAINMLRTGGFDHIDGVFGPGDRAFYRVPGRAQIHSLFTSGTSISQNISARGLRTMHPEWYRCSLQYVPNGNPLRDPDSPDDINEPEEPDNGPRLSSASTGTDINNIVFNTPMFSIAPMGNGMASGVSVRFSSSNTTFFRHDLNDNLYYVHTHNGSSHIDGNTHSQLAVTNVIVIRTDISPIPGDGAGRLSIATVGFGSGYYINGGNFTEITWSRSAGTSQFEYRMPDGSPVLLGYGKTYICIVPMDARVNIN